MDFFKNGVTKEALDSACEYIIEKLKRGIYYREQQRLFIEAYSKTGLALLNDLNTVSSDKLLEETFVNPIIEFPEPIQFYSTKNESYDGVVEGKYPFYVDEVGHYPHISKEKVKEYIDEFLSDEPKGTIYSPELLEEFKNFQPKKKKPYGKKNRENDKDNR